MREEKRLSKILRKVRVKARIVNLSLQEGENTVTYIPLTPINWSEGYKDKWAYYDVNHQDELERAINSNTPIELFIHRVATLRENGEFATVFDLIVKAKIAYR